MFSSRFGKFFYYLIGDREGCCGVFFGLMDIDFSDLCNLFVLGIYIFVDFFEVDGVGEVFFLFWIIDKVSFC